MSPVYVNFVNLRRQRRDLGLLRFRQCIGLGNLLCSWGDAMLYAKYQDLPVLWPTWPQVSREALRSGRVYSRLFRSDGTYVGGADRVRTLARWQAGHADAVTVVGPKVPYDVDWTHGRDLAGDQEALRQALHAIVAPPHRRRVDTVCPQQPFVAVHVRRGDFNNPVHHVTDGGGQRINQPLPTEWYSEAIGQARRATGYERVLVVSDGTDDELAFLTRQPGVRLQRENALVDMLTASRASAFVASGSTFSQWIAYLGQMPTWLNPTFSWSHNLHVDPATRIALS